MDSSNHLFLTSLLTIVLKSFRIKDYLCFCPSSWRASEEQSAAAGAIIVIRRRLSRASCKIIECPRSCFPICYDNFNLIRELYFISFRFMDKDGYVMKRIEGNTRKEISSFRSNQQKCNYSSLRVSFHYPSLKFSSCHLRVYDWTFQHLTCPVDYRLHCSHILQWGFFDVRCNEGSFNI